jgi:hypothetical protein
MVWGASLYVGLIDTGSNLSLIHSDVFHNLGRKYYQVLEMPIIDSALVANSNKINVSHFIRLEFKLDDKTIFLDTYVCPSISFELILGAHFLKIISQLIFRQTSLKSYRSQA